MCEQDEAQLPEDSQYSDKLPVNDSESRVESIEVRFEFEQRVPGGKIRFSRHSVTRPRRSKRGTSFRFSTLIIVPLVIFFTIIAIGLIAVGPEGVWDEVKNLLPSLFEEKL
jgi:hypothetical protein